MALRTPRRLHDFHGNRLQTAPEVEPITLTEVKTHLRITDDAEDLYLFGLIQECREEIEARTGVAFITQTWRLTLDQWPGGKEDWWDGTRECHIDEIYGGGNRYASSVRLPRYPLINVTAVSTFAEDGTETAVTVADVFDIDTQSMRGRLTLKRGATWPAGLKANNAIQIDYTAGYGAAAVSVPPGLKRALRQMVAYSYEHRGDGCEPGDAYMKSGAKALMDQYRDVEV